MIYLNNTATSFPKPESVINAINEYLLNAPANIGRSSNSSTFFNDTRDLILEFFNAQNNYNVIFTSGSTESINMAIFGLNLKGKEVIISSAEHNSVIRPLMELQSRNEITLKIAQCDNNGSLDINKVIELINENTALIILNYVSNVTGNILPINEISKNIENKNIRLFIDGSQAAGNIDINLNEIKPDFMAFTAHKSLFGLQGSGGLIINNKTVLKPFKYGGTGFKSTLLTQPDEFPHKYESGTQNIPGIISIRSGIEFINEVGLKSIINHKKKLMGYIIEEFGQIDNIKLFYDNNSYSHSVLSFTIGNIAPEEISYILKSAYNIEIRTGIHCAPLLHKNLGTYPNGTARVSPSYFNKDDEVGLFIDVVKKIAQEYK